MPTTPPAPPTGLTVAPVSNDERVLAAWTAPAGDYDGVRVSMRQSGTTPWVVQYLNVDPGALFLYPLPGVSYDYRVQSVYQGVFSSTAAEVDAVTLPWWCDTWALTLTDTATKVEVRLGMLKDFSTTKRTRRSNVKSYVPMGGVFPKDFKSRAKYRVWPAITFTVFPNDVLNNGTIVDNQSAVIDAIELFFPPTMSLLLWRDAIGLSTYVTIAPEPDITLLEDGGWEITLNIEERTPPAYPLTSTT